MREGSAGAGRHRGGYGIDYQIRLLRGRPAPVPDGSWPRRPAGPARRRPGATNEILVSQGGTTVSPHLSKGEGYELTPGDWVPVRDARRRRLWACPGT